MKLKFAELIKFFFLLILPSSQLFGSTVGGDNGAKQIVEETDETAISCRHSHRHYLHDQKSPQNLMA